MGFSNFKFFDDDPENLRLAKELEKNMTSRCLPDRLENNSND